VLAGENGYGTDFAKVTSYTLKHLFRNSFGLDVQTFQVAEA
jgi:hypothetical protein